jgi:glycosyltransferase involved in cell wall biosynthesis
MSKTKDIVKYAVVIPAKNESQTLPVVLESLVQQTLLPQLVVVVNDASEDNTGAVVERYSKVYPFIMCLNRHAKDVHYSLGGKVVEVFHEGWAIVLKKCPDCDFIVKMDADIEFQPALFEKINNRIRKQGPYGIVSCTPYLETDGKRKLIHSPVWHTNGDFKMYASECLQQMGGLKTDLGWDCADNIIAMEMGWRTIVFRDLYYKQERPIGRDSIKKGIVRQGIGAYKLRYSGMYIFFKLVHDLFAKPYFAGSFLYLKGYFRGRKKYPGRTLTERQGRHLRKLLWKSFFKRFTQRQFALMQKK